MADQNPTSGGQSFQQAIEQNAGKDLEKGTQDGLNTPWSDPKTSLSPEDKAFMEDLVNKINSGVINVYQASTILNQSVYDQLSPENKAKTDIWLQATLANIRRIKDFYDNPHDNNSDMMIDMIKELRLKKETLEKEIGDVLKI